jgi:hypothetical protein
MPSTDKPRSTRLPVMTLAKTPPSRVKAATSAAPLATARAAATTMSGTPRRGLSVIVPTCWPARGSR